MRARWITSALALSTTILLVACGSTSRPIGDDPEGEEGGSDTGGTGGTKAGSSGASGKAQTSSSSSKGGSEDPAGTGGAASSGKTGGAKGTGGSSSGSSGNKGKGGGSSSEKGGGGGAATGSSGAAGTAGKSTPTESDNSPGGGYFVSGSWHGWMWPTAIPDGTATTISPSNYDDVGENGPWCMKGSVASDPDYANSAMLGINLNQDKIPPDGEESAEQKTWTPTSDGFTIDFKNTEGTTLRVQIQTASDADADHRWCYTLKAPGFIKWSDFNTTCWDNKGKAYDKQPISQMMLQVPSDSKKAVAFDFCLNSLKDGDSSGGTCNAPSGKLTTQYERSETTKDCKTYYMIQNNVWGESKPSVDQVLEFTGTNVKMTTPASCTSCSSSHDPSAAGNKPFGFPSIFFGSNGDEDVRNNPLPKKMSEITSASTSWKTNAGGSISGNYNATYDIWFNKDNTSTNPPNGGYLMVWFYHAGGVNPVGSANGKTFTSGGKSFKVWVGPQSSVQVVSYVADSAMTDFTFDVKEFFDDAVKNNYGGFQSSWYLTAVMAGWEYWSGGSGLTTSDFSVAIK